MENDVHNCGACGHDCNQLPRVDGASCRAGQCVIEKCRNDYLDCNTSPGCETSARSPRTCGSCTHDCGMGMKCGADHSCVTECEPDEIECSGSCISSWDLANCGACGNQCVVPKGGTVGCKAGQCVPACDRWGDVVCDGVCTSTLSDPKNCGACGKVCAVPPGGEAVCYSGSCNISCPLGTNACSGACVPESPASCGGGCAPCPTSPHGSAACKGGLCSLTCDSGYSLCSSDRCCPAWSIELVDSPFEGGELPSLALSAAGLPRLAYRDPLDGALRYAHLESEWVIETAVSGPDVGPAPQLVIDPSGVPHILVLRGAGVYHAWKPANVWLVEPVDNALGLSSLQAVLDGSGAPEAAWLSASEVRHARWDGNAWSVETVAASSGASELAMASGHLAWAAGSTIIYAHFDGTAWTSGPIAVDHAHGLALIADARPRVYYIDDASHVKQALLDGTWSFTQVGTNAGTLGGAPLDDAGNPRLVFQRWDNQIVQYARFTGAAWQVDATPYTAVRPRLAVGPRGETHLAWDTDAQIRHAQLDPTWLDELVDYRHVTGATNLLAIDHAGRPQVIYTDTAPGYSLGKWATRDDGWQRSLIFSGPGVPLAMAIDPSNRPALLLPSNTSLWFLPWNGSSWDLEHVGATTGGRSSLAFDAAGTPHVAYSQGGLYYATRDGSGKWTSTLVDAYANGTAAIAIDSTGVPHIAYGAPNSVYYATPGPSGWTSALVAPAYPNAYVQALELDGSDRPYLWFYFYSFANVDVHYVASGGGGSWKVVIAPTRTKDLAVTSDGTVVLAVMRHDYSPKEAWRLQAAKRDGDTWSTHDVVTLAYDVDVDLALRANGKAVISFYDALQQRLRAAFEP